MGCTFPCGMVVGKDAKTLKCLHCGLSSQQSIGKNESLDELNKLFNSSSNYKRFVEISAPLLCFFLYLNVGSHSAIASILRERSKLNIDRLPGYSHQLEEEHK